MIKTCAIAFLASQVSASKNIKATITEKEYKQITGIEGPGEEATTWNQQEHNDCKIWNKEDCYFNPIMPLTISRLKLKSQGMKVSHLKELQVGKYFSFGGVYYPLAKWMDGYCSLDEVQVDYLEELRKKGVFVWAKVDECGTVGFMHDHDGAKKFCCMYGSDLVKKEIGSDSF